MNKGKAFVHLKRFQAALECCEEYLSLQPDDHEANILKVRSLKNLKRYHEAIEVIREALGRNPKNSLWHCYLARIFEEAGNKKKAQEHYTFAKTFLKGSKSYLNQRDILWIERFFGRIKEIEILFEKSHDNYTNLV